MKITSIRVINYKCFLDSEKNEFGSGFNFIVGRNDAGKSALVEALSLNFANKPHRSLATVPTIGTLTQVNSAVQVTYDVLPQEMQGWLSRQQEAFISIGTKKADIAMEDLLQKLTVEGKFVAFWDADLHLRKGWLEVIGEPPNQIYGRYENKGYPTSFQPKLVANISASNMADYGHVIANGLRDLTYAFKAERMNIGECIAGSNTNLQPNAANLPEVVNQLISTNPVRYGRLMEHVRTIFTHVSHVTAPINADGKVRILVWSGSINSDREDLAVPLSDSGTGIGQVLAMLYVVVTSSLPKIIIIDEPQSFLHPGAFRKLLEILRGYPQHQYIITTHAPIAVGLSDDDRMILEPVQCL
jgi:predicted ATPase